MCIVTLHEQKLPEFISELSACGPYGILPVQRSDGKSPQSWFLFTFFVPTACLHRMHVNLHTTANSIFSHILKRGWRGFTVSSGAENRYDYEHPYNCSLLPRQIHASLAGILRPVTRNFKRAGVVTNGPSGLWPHS